MTTLSIGDIAPDFCLPDQSGEVFCLHDQNGKYTVLYFYPRDSTPGCTRQAKDFSANLASFQKLNVQVIGINPDTIESHKKFVEKNDLTIRLLSDEKRDVVEAYGVWKEKSMYGKKFMGVVRSTFIINSEGKICAVWPKVSVPGHIEELLSVLATTVAKNGG